MIPDKTAAWVTAVARGAMCIGALVCSVSAGAAPQFEQTRLRLVVNGLSRHYDTETPRERLREVNTGLGLEARWPAGLFATAASYIDSYDGRAWFAAAGKRWPWWRSSGGELYVAGGLMAGVTYRRLYYGEADRDWTGGVLPLVTLGAGPVEANLTVLPKIPDLIDDPAFAVNFSLPLN